MAEADTLNRQARRPISSASLKLWHLIVYGIIIIQPTAPMGIYGVVSNEARGHVVTTILIAMVAMLFTAVSYGRMARVYPSAGSAFTYVGKELHPLAGYVVGWSMLMDYLLNPIICAIWCSAAARNILPDIPYATWAVSFVILFTALNLFGVKSSGNVNAVLALLMGLVVVIFLAYAIRYLAFVARPVGGQWLTPFYDPSNFSSSRLFRGTSIAVLTYIGFDGISTMSEEVENPRRNIMLGTVLTCLFIGILSAIEVYVAQLGMALPWPIRQLHRGYCLRSGRDAHRWQVSLSPAQCHTAHRQHGLRHGRTIWRGAAAVWHGPQQRAATRRLRFTQREDRHTAQQCSAGRPLHPDRRFPPHLRKRCGDAQLWRLHCLHGGQRRGARSLQIPLERKGAAACAGTASRAGRLRLHMAQPGPQRADTRHYLACDRTRALLAAAKEAGK